MKGKNPSCLNVDFFSIDFLHCVLQLSGKLLFDVLSL